MAAIAMLATFRKTGASQFVEPDAVRAVHEFQHLVQFRMPMAYLEVAEALSKGTAMRELHCLFTLTLDAVETTASARNMRMK